MLCDQSRIQMTGSEVDNIVTRRNRHKDVEQNLRRERTQNERL